MFNKSFEFSSARFALVLMLIVRAFGVIPVRASAKATSESAPVVNYLNPDGTLKLDGGVSGSVNLQGWDVQIDPVRGPVFNLKEESNASAVKDVPLGQWDSLGSSGAIGGVNAIAVHDNDIYVVGGFTDAGGIPEADYVAKWDGEKWSALGGNGMGNGAIYGGSVYAIAISGTDVYIGGDFGSINNYGNVINYGAVAKWDGTNWSALGNLNIGNYLLNGHIVRTITVSDANVYVGGDFYDLYSNGVVIADGVGLIKWDGTHWAALGGNSAPNSISAMAIIGTDIYVGGDFIDAGSIAEADFVAKWDGMNWSALGSNGAGDGSLNSNVYSLTAVGTDLYVGGKFSNAGGVPEADVIAKWNGTNWTALGSNGSGDGALDPTYMYVKAISVSGPDIYVGRSIGPIRVLC